MTLGVFISLGTALSHWVCFCFTGNVPVSLGTSLSHWVCFHLITLGVFLFHWKRSCHRGMFFFHLERPCQTVFVSLGTSLSHWVCFRLTGNVPVTLGMFSSHWERPCYIGYVFNLLGTAL